MKKLFPAFFISAFLAGCASEPTPASAPEKMPVPEKTAAPVIVAAAPAHSHGVSPKAAVAPAIADTLKDSPTDADVQAARAFWQEHTQSTFALEKDAPAFLEKTAAFFTAHKNTLPASFEKVTAAVSQYKSGALKLSDAYGTTAETLLGLAWPATPPAPGVSCCS